MWLEGTREIVYANESSIKFIISDHPVTIYNYACAPDSQYCEYPNDPSTALIASQTIFPLDKNHCLILTNYEYANAPSSIDPTAKRTHARNFGQTLTRTNAFPRGRKLTEKQVREINFIIKKRARRFIAAAEKEWLYPETDESISWQNVRETLMLPSNNVHEFGGEMFVGYKDGSIYSQDAFGRTSPEHTWLKKDLPIKKPNPNDYCPCGQGKKYKKCCKNKSADERPSWEVFSIRERNRMFYKGVNDILCISEGKDWDDVRRELNEEQVKEIHLLYGELWPSNTDIISLLPKPDRQLRAVYMGVLDVRVITQYVCSGTLYFDELIVQNPFLNPTGIRPEHSPVECPSEFKQQTIKNVMFFFMLYPLIDAGKVNLIPDLGFFNKHLQFQVLDIAKQKRDSNPDINQQELENLQDLFKEDFQRMLWSMPKDYQLKQFKDAFPDEKAEFVQKAFEYSQKKRKDDPLALLQDDLFSNGGQVNMLHLSPGIEMALFLAQVTGAIIFTDSATR